METTGKALVEHWNWAISKGLMNRNTGNALRAACAKVLPVLEGWEEVDVRELDVEDTLKRFVNLHSKDFKPDSLDAYKRRFRQAVSSFLEYGDDPAAWKPLQREPSARRNDSGNGAKTGASSSTREPAARGELKGSNLHEYDFPIRAGLMAKLVVPRDVTSAEMKRLITWARTLAIDSEPEAA
jgi:hypothetical protein